jgi:hypothetical protein
MEIKSRMPRKPRNYFKRSLANSQRLPDDILETVLEVFGGNSEGSEGTYVGTSVESLGKVLSNIRKGPDCLSKEKRVLAAAFIGAELLLRKLLRDNKQVKACPLCGNAVLPE